MTVIKMEGTENKPHTFKGDIEFMKTLDVYFHHVYITRCPRCDILFISDTDRKYCSKDCQYNRKKVKQNK